MPSFVLEPAAPPPERKVTHNLHLLTEEDSSYHGHGAVDAVLLLSGQENTFYVQVSGAFAQITRQVEPAFKEPLEDFLSFLRDTYPLGFNLNSFQPGLLNTVVGADAKTAQGFRFYQTPMPTDYYTHKLKRFKKTGYEVRVLTKEDLPAMERVRATWVQEKNNLYLRERTLQLDSLVDVRRAREELQRIESELQMVLNFENHSLDWGFRSPQNEVHGVFQDEELLGYTITRGNNTFQMFESRASIRRNSLSPQDFLDYSVAHEFVERGVRVFDRGPFTERAGMRGLLEYKKKLGPLTRRMETDYFQFSFSESPDVAYMRSIPDTTFGPR